MEYKKNSLNPSISTHSAGRVENRKCWKITKPQVDPIDAHKNKTVDTIPL